jgi:immunity protein, SdpI family
MSRRWPLHALILAGYVMGVIALAVGLPEQMPPSWTLPGQRTVWLGAPMAAWLLPTAAAVADALLRRLAIRHAFDDSPASGVLAIYDAIMWRFTLFVVGVHATVLMGLLGMLRGRPWAGQIVPVMLGLTMIGIGNLLPRIRPNPALGIRTRWTLSDRGRWASTHRTAGYVGVVCGVVIVGSAIALPRPIGPAMILLMGPAALVATWLLVAARRTRAHA